MFRTLLRAAYLSTPRRYSSAHPDAPTHFLHYVPVKSGAGAVNVDELNKMVGLSRTASCSALLVYFSAGWCPSCKLFTPKIKKFYDEARGSGLRVLWISKDKSAEEQQEYYEKSLPPAWMYIPLGKENSDFFKLYDVKTIPAVRLVDGDGHVVDDRARAKIESATKDDPEETPEEVLEEWKAMLSKHS